ncbi:spore coat protein YsxE [Heyndrickxia ginsengihumi]|uniref:Spore coat protein YsxE n=1 Tax=Heyndrickxia ginsengihumi TaxID=363870 RepID=A0A6M0P8N8_9BACI|nr:spore coat protein YsxE [Heyndrickxia ginsengihumi]MBE6183843.1 spore coat protein YsxE [Bacillus sp. (in: firmicutes)]MCM3021905.1 spore coat protein YsxE [Heyndrickxia ginsengihumi]NEY20409.1 spore coat protein YsxE [Heyndrickxia ginsengihumi]
MVKLNELTQQEIENVIQVYGIHANYVDQYGKTYKIYSDHGIFALKKILPANGMDFIRHVQFLYQRGYNRIIPIYPAPDGRYGVLYKGYLFYLMPWLPNEEKEDRSEKHQKMFRELARLHSLSVKEIAVSTERRQEHYDETIDEWDRQRDFLEEFIERCEQQWYMSPFELLFCTFYKEITQALAFSKRQLEEWLEESKEVEKVRTVVAHGKISIEHFLYDERGRGYFANFEKAKIAAPFHDILPFLARTLHTYPKRFDDCVDWIKTYMSYFPLRAEEKHLFFSYLAHPGPIIKVVEDYMGNQEKRNEIKYVKRLQEKYWLLKNTEYVVMNFVEQNNQQTN